MATRYVAYEEWTKDVSLTRELNEMLRLAGSAGVWSINDGARWGRVDTGGCFGGMPDTPGIRDAHAIRVILHLGDAHNTSNDVREWWHDMILDTETSPWKDVFIADPIVYHGSPSSKKNVLEVKVKPSMSFSNVMNMLIATRQSRVEPGSVHKVYKTYTKYHKSHNMTFAEALAYAILTNANKRVVPNAQIFVSGNGWLTRGRDFDARYMAQQRLGNSINPFSDGDYWPSCSTWETGKGFSSLDEYLNALGGKTDTREPIMKYDWYGEPFTKSRYNSYVASVVEVLCYLRSDIKK